jgi:hypothetical protein
MGLPVVKPVDNCVVCGVVLPVPHDHHVIPQEYGGEKGPTVPICGDCHTKVHAEAESLLAHLRNNRGKPVRRVWETEKLSESAKPYVSAIVKSALRFGGTKPYVKMHQKIDNKTHAALKRFKLDNGFGNLEEAVLFCIRHTIKTYKGQP